MTRTRHTYLSAALLMAAVLALAQLWAVPAAFGQAEPLEVRGLEIDQALLDQPWVDPIEEFELKSEPLAPIPDVDFGELSASSVFETGVENLPVREEADVDEEREQHLRAAQAVATGELARATVDADIALSEARIDAAGDEIAAARNEIGRIEQEITSAEGEMREIFVADRAEIDEQERLNSEVRVLNSAIVEVALQAFTGENMELETLLTDPDNTEVIERRVITNEVREFQREDIADLEALIRSSELVRAELAADLAPIEAANLVRANAIADLNTEIDALANERSELRDEILQLRDRGDELDDIIERTVAYTEVTGAKYRVAYHQRLDSFVEGTDIPLVALNAYVRASNTLAVEDPGCGIHWSQIAGIARIESIHGYFGDSTLDVNGQTTEDILGIPLDGRILSGQTTGPVPDATGRTQETNGLVRLARITDTDNGRLDGDREFDRAVGPMQFIPTTWSLYESDGNDDGRSDPQNIYDAALATANYLCDSAGSMLTTAGEQRGYFAYNHDLAYSANVTRAGRGYHQRLDVVPESAAFARFALLPTPEEIATAEAAAKQAAEDAARAEAIAACTTLGGAWTDVDGSPDGADGAAENVAADAGDVPQVAGECVVPEGIDDPPGDTGAPDGPLPFDETPAAGDNG